MMDVLEEFILCIKGFVNAYKGGWRRIGEIVGQGREDL